MCTYLIAIGQDEDFPLIIAGNRDEFLSRDTQPLQHWQPDPKAFGFDFWPEGKKVLAGKDNEAGGTWLGLADDRWALVTNVRKLDKERPTALSRGELPLRWLAGDQNLDEFSSWMESQKGLYNPFNLLFGEGEQVHFSGSYSPLKTNLPKGIFGLSNASLDTPWPKVEKGKQGLKSALGQSHWSDDDLLKLLSDTRTFPDVQLPKTGVPIEIERMLSAMSVQGENYGSRVRSILKINSSGELSLREYQVEFDTRL